MSTRSVIIAVLAIFLSAHRLPAPIVEENPTPTPVAPHKPEVTPSVPAQSATSQNANQSLQDNNSKRKSGTVEKRRNATEKHNISAAELRTTPMPLNQSLFDGTWKGSINLVPARNWHGTGRLIGTFNVRLLVSNDGTEITEECRNASVPLRTQRDGKTIRWQSSIFRDLSCSLTPNPDGKSALVMFRNDFYGEPVATFEKTVP